MTLGHWNNLGSFMLQTIKDKLIVWKEGRELKGINNGTHEENTLYDARGMVTCHYMFVQTSSIMFVQTSSIYTKSDL